MGIISRTDEMVMLAVWRLQGEAYGVPIRRFLLEATGSEWSVGAIYDSLERLTRWGFLLATMSDPTPERGGRRKRFFTLTRAGVRALEEAKEIQEQLWAGLPEPELGDTR